jgi:hypothetical protein
MESSYILTAEMDNDSFTWLDGLRRRHVPTERNFIPAHLTLFHRLSAAQVVEWRLSATPDAPIAICFDQVVFLGFGVALRVKSNGLRLLREAIQTKVGGEFSRQDSQLWKPHVTV